MRRKALLGILVLCIVALGLFSAGIVAAEKKISKPGEVIYEGDYEWVWLWGLSKDEKLNVDVTVVDPAGAKVDVYILTDTQYTNYQSGSSFTAKVAKEGVSSTDFSFKPSDMATYYLVIDNKDNAKTTDAVPTGDVTVDYEYTDPLSATIGALEEAGETAFMLCILGIVVIVIIVVVVIVVIIKVASKGKQPPAQPQQPYPQQPYPQQPYPQQPYPQQQYGPPPGEQPPQGQPPQQPPGGQAYYPPPPNPQGAWPPQQPNQPPPEQ